MLCWFRHKWRLVRHDTMPGNSSVGPSGEVLTPMFPIYRFKCDRCGRRVWQVAGSIAVCSYDTDYPARRYDPVRRAIITTS